MQSQEFSNWKWMQDWRGKDTYRTGLEGCGVGYGVFLETMCVMEGEAVALPGCIS